MKRRFSRPVVLGVLLGCVVVLGALGAAGYAATRPEPVPPEEYVAPAWAPPDQAKALKESYTQDYLDDVATPDDTTPILPSKQPPNFYDSVPLSYVAEEDREAVRDLLKKGLEPDLLVRPDGKMALRK